MPTLVITKSLSGRELKTPLILELSESETSVDLKLRRYIIESFLSTRPKLAKFTFENVSTMSVAKHLLFNKTASYDCLRNYVSAIYRFSEWVKIEPDKLVNRCKDADGVAIPKVLIQTRQLIEDYLAYLHTQKISPYHKNSLFKGVLALFRLNDLRLDFPFKLCLHNILDNRSPSAEELQRLVDIADLRGRVIVTMLATGGLRLGTLANLQYRHVKKDLERNVIPIHVSVPAEITKGKYNGYYTFINEEASNYLNSYLEVRKIGTLKIPPEKIQDETPLIRYPYCVQVKPANRDWIYKIIHELYFKAGINTRNRPSESRNYGIRPHSLRKFFRTELAARGVNREYIEFMMGHKTASYHDIKMNSIEFMRGVYLTSGISIRPRTKLSKTETLKEIMRAWGLNPEKILNRDFLDSQL